MTTRILVVRPGAIGDTILALPALQALAARRSPATLDLVGYPSVLRLVECAVPPLRVEKIHSIDRAVFASLFTGRLSDELAAFLGSYDLVVAWVHDRTGQLDRQLDRLSVAHLRADPYPRADTGIHASRHLIDTLSPLGLGGFEEPAGVPRVVASPEASREGEAILRNLGVAPRGFLAIHPGSGSERKNWPAERFAAVLRTEMAEGRRVVVVQGESDADAVERLGRSVGRTLTCVREAPLPVLAALLSRAGAFLGNDSGVSHLAAATGTATLALFGPTDPALWAPRGDRARVLGFDASVERVWAELRRLRDKKPKS